MSDGIRADSTARSSGGVEQSLHYLDQGAGRVVVLIHGIGASLLFWDSTVENLLGSRRIVAVDLPGFGQSPAPRGFVEISTYSDSVAALMRTLRLAGSDVVGHSLGGLIAQRLAIDHSDLVGNLVLVSPGDMDVGWARKAAMAIGFRSASWVMLRVSVARMLSTAKYRGRLVDAVCARSHVPPAVLIDILSRGLISPGFSQALAAGLRDRTFTESNKISAPTLILQGKKDRLVTVHSARALADRIPHADCQVWDAAGHCPMFDCPNEFAAVIAALPDRRPASGAR